MQMSQSLQIIGDLGIYYERIAVVLGFVTLAAFALTFVSCRSFVPLINRLTHKNLLDSKLYQSFYKYHSYYWWLFLVILIVHAMSASIHTELIPPADDPDAFAHWLILGFALGALVSFSIQFTSCRTFTNLINLFTQKSLLRFRIYHRFYDFHAYYWWIFFIVVTAHITAAAIHTNFWPS